jgi:hypothetical protein
MDETNQAAKMAQQTNAVPTGLRIVTGFFAVWVFFIGVVFLYNAPLVAAHHEKTLLWFALALLAFLIPYLNEVTFKDFKLTFQKYQEALQQVTKATEKLEGIALTARELHYQVNATRRELIRGYREYLDTLPEEERNEKVIILSELYREEMGVESIRRVKEWLNELGVSVRVNDNLDGDYINALKKFQAIHGLDADGIFGYFTYRMIQQVRSTARIATSPE